MPWMSCRRSCIRFLWRKRMMSPLLTHARKRPFLSFHFDDRNLIMRGSLSLSVFCFCPPPFLDVTFFF